MHCTSFLRLHSNHAYNFTNDDWLARPAIAQGTSCLGRWTCAHCAHRFSYACVFHVRQTAFFPLSLWVCLRLSISQSLLLLKSIIACLVSHLIFFSFLCFVFSLVCSVRSAHFVPFSLRRAAHGIHHIHVDVILCFYFPSENQLNMIKKKIFRDPDSDTGWLAHFRSTDETERKRNVDILALTTEIDIG